MSDDLYQWMKDHTVFVLMLGDVLIACDRLLIGKKERSETGWARRKVGERVDLYLALHTTLRSLFTGYVSKLKMSAYKAYVF